MCSSALNSSLLSKSLYDFSKILKLVNAYNLLSSFKFSANSYRELGRNCNSKSVKIPKSLLLVKCINY